MRLTKILTAVVAVVVTCALSACGPSESPTPGSATARPAAPASPPPFGFLNTPAENQKVDPGTLVSGWALDNSGIADVAVVFDDGQKAYVHLGDDFPGVKQSYPNYPDADKAGYVFFIPKMTPGPHSLTVTVKAKDSGKMEILRHFSIP